MLRLARKGFVRRLLGATAACAALLAAGCSNSDGADKASGERGAASGATGSSASAAAFTRPACSVPAADPVEAPATPEVASDYDMVSFDGTKIRMHWFPEASATKAAPKPTVLMGPGWSLPGDTKTNTIGVLGALNIDSLNKAGFNVLTWDPRGFGASTGVARVDDPAYEGKDVQRLLDWVTAQPEAALDAKGDPRVGMVGGSYGGGIQLVAAGIDCRIDAIVPVIAWHDLPTSLDRANTPKLGWGTILGQVGGENVDPHVNSANAAMNSTGVISEADREWFAGHDMTDSLAKISVPTLIVQGTVDTLFALDEGVANYRALRDRNVPVSMMWFCGGHGACLTKANDPDLVVDAALDWLGKYVSDDASVKLGARVSLLDQNGTVFTADDYPAPAGTPIDADGSGTLELKAEGGAGPVAEPPGKPDMLSGLVLPVTPAKASNAVNVSIDVGSSKDPIVGAPKVSFTYSGTVAAGERPTRVFAQLVDDKTGLVLGNQITPIEVTLDGKTHEATSDLETVMFTPAAGDKLTLQLVATTVAYIEPRLGGSVDFSKIHIELPTATGLKAAG